MAGETFLKGKVKIISIWDGSAYRPVACDTSNTLGSNLAEGPNVVTKCDPDNVVSSPGAFSYTLSGEGIQIDTGTGGDTTKASWDYLFGLQQAKTLVTWRRASGLATNTYYYGTAYVQDLEDTGEAGEDDPNASFTFTLRGKGAVVTVDPNAT